MDFVPLIFKEQIDSALVTIPKALNVPIDYLVTGKNSSKTNGTINNWVSEQKKDCRFSDSLLNAPRVESEDDKWFWYGFACSTTEHHRNGVTSQSAVAYLVLSAYADKTSIGSGWIATLKYYFTKAWYRQIFSYLNFPINNSITNLEN